MKRRKSTIFIGLLGILIIVSFKICIAGDFRAGGGTAIALGNDNVKGAVGFNVDFDYVTPNIITLRTSIGRYASETKVNKASEGTYSLFWIEGSALLRAPNPVVEPYVGCGIGYYFIDHELSSDLIWALWLLGFDGKEEIDNTWGINFKGGIDIKVSSAITFSGGIKYLIIKPTVRFTLASLTYPNLRISLEEKAGFNTFIIRVSLLVKL